MIGCGISTMTSSKIASDDDDIQDGRRQGLGLSHPQAPSLRSTIVPPLRSSERRQGLSMISLATFAISRDLVTSYFFMTSSLATVARSRDFVTSLWTSDGAMVLIVSPDSTTLSTHIL